MKIIKWSDIPIIMPDNKDGYWEVYKDHYNKIIKKIWHEGEYPFNEENDIEFPEQEPNVIPQNKMKLKSPTDFVIAGQDVKNDDLIIFLDEGKYNTLPQDPDREVLTFKVKIPSGEEKSISINKTSQIELTKAWTDESSKWVGKKAKVKIVNQKVFKEFKDVIYLFPAEGKIPTSEEIPEAEPEFPEEE